MRIFTALIILSCLFIEACKCNKEQPDSRPVNSEDLSYFQDTINTPWIFQRNSGEPKADTLRLGAIQSGVPREGNSGSSCYPYYYKTIVKSLNYNTKDTLNYYLRPTQIFGGTETSSFSVMVAQNLYFTKVGASLISLNVNGVNYDSVYVLKPNYPLNTGKDVFPDSIYYQRKAGMLRYVYRSSNTTFIQWNRAN